MTSPPPDSPSASDANARGDRRLQLGAAIVFLALIAVAIVVIVGSRGEPPVDTASSEVVGLRETQLLYQGVEQNGFELGDPRAPVTIVQVIDLQCPFCRDHELDEGSRVVTELVRTKQAKLLLTPLAFLGEDSVAGRAALARLAGKDRAYQFMRLWFANQGPEGSGYADQDYIAKLAVAAGGSADDATPRTPSGPAAELVDESIALAQALLDAPSSPKFAVGLSSEPPASYKVLPTGADADELAEAVRATASGGR